MSVNPVSRLVEHFLEGNTNLEDYALVFQPESAKESSENALWVFWNREDTNPSPAIPDRVRQRIKGALERFTFKDSYVLVQFWAPYQTANESGCLLKTLNQPFGITDVSPELLAYRMASLKKEYDVNLESKQDNELIGNVFLKGSPDWILNNGGHLAIPVFEDHGRFALGVLEIVTTIEKESYDWEFIESCRALQGVNLRSSQVLFCSMNEVRQGSKPNVKANVGEGVRQRRKPTKTSKITYEDLSSRFHMPRDAAAKELDISRSSLLAICRKFNIDRWPYEKESRGFGTTSLSSTGEEDDGGKSPMEASDHPH